MLKLLRQYNQWILVVGGTLLLITFLMPSAIQGLAQRSAVSGALWATYAGGDVTGSDLEEARQELRVLEFIPNGTLNFLGADKNPAHWWLLVHEAEQAGLLGGEGEASAALEQLAVASGVGKEQANQVRDNLVRASQTSPDVVLMTLAKIRAVSKLVNLATQVDRVSDRRLKHAAASALLSVSGEMVVIDARKSASIEAAAPAPQKLDEQFKNFAGKPRPADSQVGMEKFGYRLPDRVKLEWMTISRGAIEQTLADSPELATLALKKRFAQNPAKYGGGSGDLANFPALEQTVRAAVLKELVTARLEEISKFSGDQLGLAQRTLKRDGAYLVLPAEWQSQMPSLQALAQTVAAEFKIAAPTYQSTGDSWTNVSDVGAIPFLGTASTLKFGNPMRTPQLVAGAKELSSPSLTSPIQMNIAGPAMSTDAGDTVFFRIIAAESARDPKSLDEVRGDVERDLLAVERFNWLTANKDAIAAQAAGEGLSAVATRFGSSVQPATGIAEANDQFLGFGMRMASGLPQFENDPKAIAAIISAARKIPFSATLGTLPAAERTIAVTIPERLSMVVLLVNSMKPVTEERYSELAGGIATPNGGGFVSVTRDPSLAIDAKELFGYDALAGRYAFKPVRDAEDIPTAERPAPPM